MFFNNHPNLICKSFYHTYYTDYLKIHNTQMDEYKFFSFISFIQLSLLYIAIQ